MERGESPRPNHEFRPGTETLKLMIINKVLATGDHDLFHKTHDFLDRVEVVDDNIELGDLGPNQITRKQLIARFDLQGEYERRFGKLE
ncbi:MAG: hypothetical protein PHW75_03145 [Patescibacteria group bacterium]|nr:hypothetical protein [Patescibacteria group bacterium]